MDLLNNTYGKEKVSKNETEIVVKQKMEYTLLGTYVISKGLKLFSYNPLNGEVKEVEINRSDTITTEYTKDGWIWYDEEMRKATIDGRLYYFEALRLQSATKRVEKFKKGTLKELFNLKEPNLDGIDFFNPLS